jgi:hypothetical protein
LPRATSIDIQQPKRTSTGGKEGILMAVPNSNAQNSPLQIGNNFLAKFGQKITKGGMEKEMKREEDEAAIVGGVNNCGKKRRKNGTFEGNNSTSFLVESLLPSIQHISSPNASSTTSSPSISSAEAKNMAANGHHRPSPTNIGTTTTLPVG